MNLDSSRSSAKNHLLVFVICLNFLLFSMIGYPNVYSQDEKEKIEKYNQNGLRNSCFLSSLFLFSYFREQKNRKQNKSMTIKTKLNILPDSMHLYLPIYFHSTNNYWKKNILLIYLFSCNILYIMTNSD